MLSVNEAEKRMIAARNGRKSDETALAVNAPVAGRE
jgi:hypothetical protein